MKKLFLLALIGLLFAACERPEPDLGEEAGQNIIRNAVKDADGNNYDAVKIGDQVWMAENLKTTHYADGTEIPMGNAELETEPYRYCPDGNSSTVNDYGYLYNWPAVMHGAASSGSNPSKVQGICPKGWHVPSNAEWEELEDYVSSHPDQYGSSVAKALASDKGCWVESGELGTPGCNQSSNNTTGFSAVPAGGYYVIYDSFGDGAYARLFYYSYAFVGRYDGNEYGGFSVRCLRD